MTRATRVDDHGQTWMTFDSGLKHEPAEWLWFRVYTWADIDRTVVAKDFEFTVSPSIM